METLMKEIPENMQEKRGWEVEIDDVVLEKVKKISLFNPNIGLLVYGMTPGGYDGWSFHENGGGGAITIPYTVINGKLYVGMIEQERHNQGGKVWNVPRGFIDPGETHFKAMQREFQEEVGLFPDRMVKNLKGELLNPNSAFFETPLSNEGGKFFAMEIDPDQLTKYKDTDSYSFNGDVLEPVSKIAELIFGSRFFPWREATRVGDMYTCGIISRLLACLPGISM